MSAKYIVVELFGCYRIGIYQEDKLCYKLSEHRNHKWGKEEIGAFSVAFECAKNLNTNSSLLDIKA